MAIRLMTDDETDDVKRAIRSRYTGERYEPPSEIELARRKRKPPTYRWAERLLERLRAKFGGTP